MKVESIFKKAALLAAAAALLLCLAGCGETAQGVVEKVNKAYAATPGVGDITTAINLDCKILPSGSEDGIQMTLAANEALALSAEPYSASGTVDTDIAVAGMETKSENDVLMVTEDDKLAVYTGKDDSWTRTESDSDATGFLSDKDFMGKLAALGEDKMTLVKDKVDVSGHTCRELDITIDGDLLSEMVSESSGVLDSGAYGADLDTVDWSGCSASMKLYVDSKTYLPVQCDLDLAGLESGLNSAVKSSGNSIAVASYTVSAVYGSFEPHEAFTVSDEIKDCAALTDRIAQGEIDNGDGTVTLAATASDGSAVYYTLMPPEGLTLADSSTDQYYIKNDNMSESAFYYAYTLQSGDDLSTICSGEAANFGTQIGEALGADILPENEQETDYAAPVGTCRVYSADYNFNGTLYCRFFGAWYSADEGGETCLYIECISYSTGIASALTTEQFESRYLDNLTTYANRASLTLGNTGTAA